MTANTVALISVVGTSTVAVVVVVLREWLAQKQDAKRQRAERLAEFSAAAWAVTLALGRIARSVPTVKNDLSDQIDLVAGERFNSALAIVRLLDPEPTYRAAVEVDRCLGALLNDARASEWSRQAWRARRDANLTPALKSFEDKARKGLDATAVIHVPWSAGDAETGV